MKNSIRGDVILIDTVAFKIPKMPSYYIQIIKEKLKFYTCVDRLTGELIYEFSVGKVKGSYDSSINFKINRDNTIRVECSLHKIILGNNIAFGSDNLILLANCLKKILHNTFNIKFPDVLSWELIKIDYTLTFDLKDIKYCDEYINSFKNITYPQRTPGFWKNESIQIPGTTTTVKIYNKYREFLKHDYKKLSKILDEEELNSLIDLSKGLIRIEVSVKTKKIKDIFPNTIYQKKIENEYKNALKKYGIKSQYVQELIKLSRRNIVTLRDFNINKIKEVWESEVFKVIKECRKDIVNKSNLVMERLKSEYGNRSANTLYGFWTILSTKGEDHAKNLYKKPTYYRNRKRLIDAGISWRDTDVILLDSNKVIRFTPSINSEYKRNLNEPDFKFKNNVYKILKAV